MPHRYRIRVAIGRTMLMPVSLPGVRVTLTADTLNDSPAIRAMICPDAAHRSAVTLWLRRDASALVKVYRAVASLAEGAAPCRPRRPVRTACRTATAGSHRRPARNRVCSTTHYKRSVS